MNIMVVERETWDSPVARASHPIPRLSRVLAAGNSISVPLFYGKLKSPLSRKVESFVFFLSSRKMYSAKQLNNVVHGKA